MVTIFMVTIFMVTILMVTILMWTIFMVTMLMVTILMATMVTIRMVTILTRMVTRMVHQDGSPEPGWFARMGHQDGSPGGVTRLIGFTAFLGILLPWVPASPVENTHRGARTHDHKVKGLALCRIR